MEWGDYCGGRMGGFMNTQIAGVGQLESWAGGGKLENIKSLKISPANKRGVSN